MCDLKYKLNEMCIATVMNEIIKTVDELSEWFERRGANSKVWGWTESGLE